MIRTVDVDLVDADGNPRGRLPTFTVAEPWWQDVTEIVDQAAHRFGRRIWVLRLVHAANDAPPGGPVRYVAELRHRAAPPRRPAAGPPRVGCRRNAYAEVGGPAASVAWARRFLAAAGAAVPLVRQRRTWNLSALWELRAPGGGMWLKEVPPFLSFETAVTSWLDGRLPGTVPAVLAAGGPRMLLRDVPGQDCYAPALPIVLEIAAAVHRVHLGTIAAAGELAGLGVADRTGARVLAGFRWIERLGPALSDRLAPVRDGALRRLAAAAECGLPSTLVHGDLHPGNVRALAGRYTILDWSNSFYGSPAFDILRLTESLDDAAATRVIQQWSGWWRRAVPGCRPERAAHLLRPVHLLARAMLCAQYLSRFEETEHKYHRQNLASYVRRLLAWRG